MIVEMVNLLSRDCIISHHDGMKGEKKTLLKSKYWTYRFSNIYVIIIYTCMYYLSLVVITKPLLTDSEFV